MRSIPTRGLGLAFGAARISWSRAPLYAALAPSPSAEESEDVWFIIYLTISMALVAIAGLMSGLTLGLMSLDAVDLEILIRSGTAAQKQDAERILPLLTRPHVLLVTLLVCNAAAAEALPIFLDRLADPVTAVLLSVTVVLVFGEIIPQAACSRHGLRIGASSAGFVKLLMYLTSPVSWPIGLLLDAVLGTNHATLFKRSQLKALVDLHGPGQAFGGALSADEVAVIKGALDLTHKTAQEAMTPLDLVFMLSADDDLDNECVDAILASGHSRVPIYRGKDRYDILGILLVKELVGIFKGSERPTGEREAVVRAPGPAGPGAREAPGAAGRPSATVTPARTAAPTRKVGDVKIRSLPYLLYCTPMYDMLKLLEIGRSHMVLLTQPTAAAREERMRAARRAAADGCPPDAPAARTRRAFFNLSDSSSCSSASSSSSDDSLQLAEDLLVDWEPHELEAVGIITIEDVLEELLQSEIVDETDRYVDNLHATRVNAALLARSLPERLRRLLPTNLLPRVGGGASLAGVSKGLGSSGRGAAAAVQAAAAVAATPAPPADAMAGLAAAPFLDAVIPSSHPVTNTGGAAQAQEPPGGGLARPRPDAVPHAHQPALRVVTPHSGLSSPAPGLVRGLAPSSARPWSGTADPDLLRRLLQDQASSAPLPPSILSPRATPALPALADLSGGTIPSPREAIAARRAARSGTAAPPVPTDPPSEASPARPASPAAHASGRPAATAARVPAEPAASPLGRAPLQDLPSSPLGRPFPGTSPSTSGSGGGRPRSLTDALRGADDAETPLVGTLWGPSSGGAPPPGQPAAWPPARAHTPPGSQASAVAPLLRDGRLLLRPGRQQARASRPPSRSTSADASLLQSYARRARQQDAEELARALRSPELVRRVSVPAGTPPRLPSSAGPSDTAPTNGAEWPQGGNGGPGGGAAPGTDAE